MRVVLRVVFANPSFSSECIAALVCFRCFARCAVGCIDLFLIQSYVLFSVLVRGHQTPSLVRRMMSRVLTCRCGSAIFEYSLQVGQGVQIESRVLSCDWQGRIGGKSVARDLIRGLRFERATSAHGETGHSHPAISRETQRSRSSHARREGKLFGLQINRASAGDC